MNNEDYFAALEKTFNDGLLMMRKKNADYSGVNDPFRNFRNAGVLGITVEQAILVRVMDKISRTVNLIDKGRQGAVVDESLSDSLMDAINYLNILKVYIENVDGVKFVDYDKFKYKNYEAS